MTFKDAELADRDGVFLDLDEFGAEVSIDGTAVTAVVDEVEFGDRDLAMGLPSSGMRVFAKTEDMPHRRMPGETVLVNGRSYMVEKWDDDMGMAEVVIVRAER